MSLDLSYHEKHGTPTLQEYLQNNINCRIIFHRGLEELKDLPRTILRIFPKSDYLVRPRVLALLEMMAELRVR